MWEDRAFRVIMTILACPFIMMIAASIGKPISLVIIILVAIVFIFNIYLLFKIDWDSPDKREGDPDFS